MLSLAYIGIKGNKEADKATKQTIGMPRITTTRLPYTEFYLIIRRARNSELQSEWKISTSKLHFIKFHIEVWENAHSNCKQYEVNMSWF